MRNLIKTAAILTIITAVSPLFAQLGIRLTLNRSVYMRFEPVYACVTFRNDSGRALVFGNDPRLQGFIYFDIRDFNGKPVRKITAQEINSTGLVLKAGETRSIVLPINDYYDISRPGDYTVHVRVAHNMLAHEYRNAGECVFEVNEGATVWKKTVGVPDLNEHGEAKQDTDRPAAERTYAVKTLDDPPNRYYYLVVEDSEKIFGVTRIGNAFGVEQFQAEADMLGRIHLLMPVTPRIFHYLAFSVDGMNIVNTYWRTTDTIPVLRRDPQTGIVKRIGGVEAKAGVDFIPENKGALSGSRIQELEDQSAPLAEGVLDMNKDVSDFDRMPDRED